MRFRKRRGSGGIRRDAQGRRLFQTPDPYPSASVGPLKILRRKGIIPSAVVIHNHPSGDPTPSRADIDMTKAIIEALKPSGVTVHDHIIIGKNGFASMKGLMLI
jgi:hypothetical protein